MAWKGPLRAFRALYFGMGLFLTLVRSAALFSWAAWHVFHTPVASNGAPISFFGTFVIGFIGTMLTPLLWPLGFILWLSGRATLTSVFLYPWFALYPT